jgi:hypothetical protein
MDVLDTYKVIVYPLGLTWIEAEDAPRTADATRRTIGMFQTRSMQVTTDTADPAQFGLRLIPSKLITMPPMAPNERQAVKQIREQLTNDLRRLRLEAERTEPGVP